PVIFNKATATNMNSAKQMKSSASQPMDDNILENKSSQCEVVIGLKEEAKPKVQSGVSNGKHMKSSAVFKGKLFGFSSTFPEEQVVGYEEDLSGRQMIIDRRKKYNRLKNCYRTAEDGSEPSSRLIANSLYECNQFLEQIVYPENTEVVRLVGLVPDKDTPTLKSRKVTSGINYLDMGVTRVVTSCFSRPDCHASLQEWLLTPCSVPPVTMYIRNSHSKFLTGFFFSKIVAFRYPCCSSFRSPAHKGPSRNRSHRRSHRDQHVEESSSDDAPTLVMLETNPWEGIKYYIPSSFEVIVPRSHDRMHRPPPGFCAFSLNHFDAGLRLPLALYVAQILRRLEICPMQLFPNSIRHIILFVIIMRVHRFEPNFDNFWTLYSFTTSIRSADNGFFYLSARKDCRYLDPLTSNVGPWKKRFIFIRPPLGREWPFRCDQINSLTSYRYDPKKVLVEEVLRLAHLSPAPIPVEGSLDDMVTQARITQRIRAAQARAAAESVANPSVAPPSATSSRPAVEGSTAPVGSPSRNSLPIDIGSEETRSRGLLRDVPHELQGSPNRSCTDESSPGGLVGRKRQRGKSPMRPNTRSRSQSLRVDPQLNSAAIEERRNMEMLNDDLRTPNHPIAELNGVKLIPDWKVSSSSTVLGSQSGQETWKLYNASCLSRDQAALLQTSFTRLEKHAAHSLIQVANFVRGLSLKCVGFRRNQIIIERRNADLRAEVQRASARGEDLENQRATLGARIKELEEKMSSEISKATSMGKEMGFAAGHVAGKIAGAIEALEIKAADYLMQGFDRCKAQVSTLNGFTPGFNATKLDPGLDGNIRPFPDEKAPPQTEDGTFFWKTLKTVEVLNVLL
ncbi:UNVERIFIED_CONTAM: hypothetical protein Sindi_1640000, partial [Sesamum indicum]